MDYETTGEEHKGAIMKWTPSGFGHDQVEFTWLDLFKMMLGKELKNGALVAKRARGQVALCIIGGVGQKTTGENNLS